MAGAGTRVLSASLWLLAAGCSGEHRIAILDGFPPSAWHLPGHARRLPLHLDGSAELTGDLPGFPLLVVLRPDRFDYAVASAGGADLRFVDAEAGALLPHEIEAWEPGGVSHVWVAADVPAGSPGPVVYLYFGDAGAPDLEDPGAVFGASFAAVLHLGPELLDSTTHDNDGVDQGTADTEGFLARGRLFGGTESIAIGDESFPAGAEPRTLCAWVRTDRVDGSARNIVAYGNGTADAGFYMVAQADSLRCGGPTRLRAPSVFVTPMAWRYVCCRYDGAAATLHVDGVAALGPEPVGDWSGLVLATAHVGGILAEGTAMAFFFGALDEVRVSSVARSDDWIAAEHLSMTDGFIRYGAVESRP